MSFTEVCGPIDDGEEHEAEGEDHEGVAVQGAVLGAAEHDAAVRRGGQPREETPRASSSRHRL